MQTPPKPKKRRRPPQKVLRVWTPEEWLGKTKWRRFAPSNPKRQAWEIIKRLVKKRRDGVKWTDRV